MSIACILYVAAVGTSNRPSDSRLPINNVMERSSFTSRLLNVNPEGHRGAPTCQRVTSSLTILHKIIDLYRFLISVTFLCMPMHVCVCVLVRVFLCRSISPFRKMKLIQNALKGQESSASPGRSLIGWIRSTREAGEDEPTPCLCVSRIWMMCRTRMQSSLVSLSSLGHLKGTIRLGFNCQLACRYINADTGWHKSRDCLAVLPFNRLFCLQSCVEHVWRAKGAR